MLARRLLSRSQGVVLRPRHYALASNVPPSPLAAIKEGVLGQRRRDYDVRH